MWSTRSTRSATRGVLGAVWTVLLAFPLGPAGARGETRTALPETVSFYAFLRTGWVVPSFGELKRLGTVGRPEDPADVLMSFPRVFSFRLEEDAQVEPSAKLLAARRGPKIRDPQTGRDLGTWVRLTGVLEVIEVQDGICRVGVKHQVGVVEPGDVVVAGYEEAWKRWEKAREGGPVPPAGLTGRVAAVLPDPPEATAPARAVVNVGTAQGVHAGAVFELRDPPVGNILSSPSAKGYVVDAGESYSLVRIFSVQKAPRRGQEVRFPRE